MVIKHKDHEDEQTSRTVTFSDRHAWMFSKESLPHYVGMSLVKNNEAEVHHVVPVENKNNIG